MKKIYLVIFVMLMGGAVSAQADTKSTNSSQSSLNPSSTTAVQSQQKPITDLPGFPVYVNTGNQELDDANYSTAKANWIKENQALYDQYVANSSGTKIKISKEKLDALPEKRRNYILERPDLYIVE